MAKLMNEAAQDEDAELVVEEVEVTDSEDEEEEDKKDEEEEEEEEEEESEDSDEEEVIGCSNTYVKLRKLIVVTGGER